MKFSHDLLERNLVWLVVLIVCVVSVGGLVEIVPLYFQKSTTEPVTGLKPYTASKCEAMMDFTLLASIVTVLAVAAFVAIVGWTISPRQTSRFATAAQLPFALPDEPMPSGKTVADERCTPGARP